MSKRRSKLAALVVAVTAVPALAVLLVYADALDRTARARQFDDWWSRPRGVYHFTGYRVRSWLDWLQAHALRRELDAAPIDPLALQLDLPRTTFDAIALDPQSAFGRDFPTDILEAGGRHAAEIRVRGDTSVHWTTEKVSFTLRLPRDDPWRGYHRLAFSCKRVLEQYVAGTLAHEFELLAPWTTVAPVYLPDGFYGLYHVLEPVDDEFLLRQRRLPGRLWRGDTAERGEVFKNVPRALFRNPYIWDLVGEKGMPGAGERATIEGLVRDLQDTSAAGRQRLLARFDLQEIGRLIALLLVVGDSFHMSDLHNQFWYEDPTDGRLHPVPWDVYVRSLHEPICTYNLLLAGLLREPLVLENALRYAHYQIDQRGLVARVERMAHDMQQRWTSAFAFDRLRKGRVSDVGDATAIAGTIAENADLLRRWAADARISCGVGSVQGGWRTLDLVSEGLAGCELLGWRWPERLPPNASFELRLDRNRNGRLDDGDPRVEGERLDDDGETGLGLSTPVPLLAAADVANLPLVPRPVAYRMFLRISGAETASVPRPELRSMIGGDHVVAGELRDGTLLYTGADWHPWDLPERAPTTIHWRGEQRLEETLVVEKGDRLVIEPGAIVSLDKGVSIVARGRIEALGTEHAPIVFRARKSKRWGTLALLGPGATGSAFEHCRFERGSGATIEGIEYHGMVSAHGVRSVVFAQCAFRDHGGCDDALHAARSDVSVLYCDFEGADGDAIDFDCSSGVIRGCRIEKARNDGIDLMGSDPLIADNVIEGCRDKGLSVGEGSRPLVFDNRVRDNRCGIEVRDAAEPVLVHDVIEGNRKGLRRETVDRRYGAGGSAVVVRSALDDVEDATGTASRSRLVVVDSVIRGEPQGERDGADLIAACLLADRRIALAATAPPGTVAEWTELAEPAVRGEESFSAFEPTAWRTTGLADHLLVRDRDLELALSGGRAAMERDVSWDASDPGRRHVVLFDAAFARCEDAAIVVERKTGAVAVPIPAGQPGHRLIAVELEPGRYTRVRLAATSNGSQGVIALRGCRRYALPR